MKRFISLAIILSFVFTLAACSAVSTPPAEPTAVPTAGPEADAVKVTQEPTEAPVETEAPEQGEFVPAGYDAHDYLALAKFFSAPVAEFETTVGELCYDDPSLGEFDVENPKTWKTDYQGVTWDSEGKATEITFYPPVPNLPAELELVGFEHLKKVYVINTLVESAVVSDCPALDGDSMVYIDAAGDISVTAGFVEMLKLTSCSEVRCSLKNENGDPFSVYLTAIGDGKVIVSAALTDDGYRVSCVASPNEYIEFLGWVDEDGNTVSEDRHLELAGKDIGSVTGAHSYAAVFANPAAPTPIAEGDYFCEIKPDVPASVDIDGDGRDDTVLVAVGKEAPDGNELSVSITLAADPDAPYVFDAGEGHSLFAAAVDTNTSDDHIEVILCYDLCDGDPITYVFRMKDDGSGFDVFTREIDLGDGGWWYNGLGDYVYRAEEGLPFSIRTEILGTYFVFDHFTVTKDGIEFMTGEFTYGYAYEMTLVKELTVKLENGKTVTLPVGSKITPYSTDRETYVKVMLEDGRIAMVEVTFGNVDYPFPVLLNGVQQDEYFDMIPYAD